MIIANVKEIDTKLYGSNQKFSSRRYSHYKSRHSQRRTYYDELQERVALMCENVKAYHSETGFIGGMVVLNSGQISNEGSDAGKALESSLKDREALIITY